MRKKAKREMHGFRRLSSEKIETEQCGPKNSDRICSLHFVDGIPTKANPLPTIHVGYNTKREKARHSLLKHPLPAKKIRVKKVKSKLESLTMK